jgi:hypothetical protein
METLNYLQPEKARYHSSIRTLCPNARPTIYSDYKKARAIADPALR